MCAPNPPPAPDYTGAAEATAAGDYRAARYAAQANRPDEFTPYGSRTWERESMLDQADYDQAVSEALASGEEPPEKSQFMMDKWTGTTQLAPEAQKAFESTQRLQTGLAGLGEQAVGQVGDLFSQRFQTEGEVPGYEGIPGELGTYGQNRQRVREAMMSRVGTDIGRDRERMSAQLIAQGIPVGSEAYNRQMEQLDRQLTDARQQAEIAATQQAGQEYTSAIAGRGQMGREAMADYSTGMEGRRQSIQEAMLNRQTPLNEISAFRTGSQVQAPQFQAYGQQPFSGGADYTGAAQQQGQFDIGAYNTQAAGKSALMGGLFSLGAGGLAGGYF